MTLCPWSFVEPLVVLLAAPLSFVGALAILIATKTPLNVASFMGLILLVGLVVKNGIILLDFTKHRMQQGGVGVHRLRRLGDTRDFLVLHLGVALDPIEMQARESGDGQADQGEATDHAASASFCMARSLALRAREFVAHSLSEGRTVRGVSM